jgi:hypothetical protein
VASHLPAPLFEAGECPISPIWFPSLFAGLLPGSWGFHANQEIFVDREAWQNSPVFRDYSNSKSSDLVWQKSCQVLAAQNDTSFCRPHHPHDALERGGFSDSIAPQEANCFTAVKAQVDALKDVALAVVTVKITDFQEHFYSFPRYASLTR